MYPEKLKVIAQQVQLQQQQEQVRLLHQERQISTQVSAQLPPASHCPTPCDATWVRQCSCSQGLESKRVGRCCPTRRGYHCETPAGRLVVSTSSGQLGQRAWPWWHFLPPWEGRGLAYGSPREPLGSCMNHCVIITTFWLVWLLI